MVSRVLLASNNEHKLGEIRAMLRPHGFDVVSPTELGLNLGVEETGTTFAENAALKAGAFGDAAGMPTLADDSGLVVEALGGEPGVYSARYGGPGLTDDDRTRLVLRRMEAIPDGERHARFVAAVAVAAVGGGLRVFGGSVEGTVTREMSGSNGFGYDPIFYYPPLGKTFAQLQPREKEQVSHRGRAVRAAISYLRTLAGEAD